jgi:tetratricopeptide (TPR) repeat protein
MVTQVAVRIGETVAGRYLGGAGATTPHRAEYSAARALAARGRYREAVDAYEIAAAESTGDPEPYLAAARILRDGLGDVEQAAAWFRRARQDARLTPGQELLVASELAELYTTKLGAPERAIPELARIAQLAPDSPQGRAAARRVRELRSDVGSDSPVRQGRGAQPPR